jgi:hypothetical protein
MASEAEGQWALMATGRAPTNIAVIKYWGKRDEALILPVNDSVSVTLDPDHLSATTTVAVSPSFASDRMWLNGKVRCREWDSPPYSLQVCYTGYCWHLVLVFIEVAAVASIWIWIEVCRAPIFSFVVC